MLGETFWAVFLEPYVAGDWGGGSGLGLGWGAEKVGLGLGWGGLSWALLADWDGALAGWAGLVWAGLCAETEIAILVY